MIACAADVAMGHLCHRELSTAVTLERDLKFLRPATGPARCVASSLNRGRSVVHLESRVDSKDGELAAVATATWLRSPKDTTVDA